MNRLILVFLIAVAATACKRTRMVKVAWDVPPTLPDGYWLRVDERTVLDIPPPPVDPTCSCLMATVPVPTGRHLVSVVAYDKQSGPSQPSVSVTVE